MPSWHKRQSGLAFARSQGCLQLYPATPIFLHPLPVAHLLALQTAAGVAPRCCQRAFETGLPAPYPSRAHMMSSKGLHKVSVPCCCPVHCWRRPGQCRRQNCSGGARPICEHASCPPQMSTTKVERPVEAPGGKGVGSHLLRHPLSEAVMAVAAALLGANPTKAGMDILQLRCVGGHVAGGWAESG